MAADTFTEVTEESWFGRLGGAFKGIIFGLLCFFGGLFLLFWNEGRAVERTKTLEEGQGAVVSISASSVDSTNEGKLVHLSGEATTNAVLTDSIFGVSANAIKLQRSVEMYQWKENSKSKTKKKVGGGTKTIKTYTYEKTWSDRIINSSNFKETQGHQNPGTMEFSSKEERARQVSLGAFSLSDSLIGKISGYETYTIDQSSVPETITSRATIVDNTIYIGNDPTSPAIGDLRIEFSIVKAGPVSVVARQVQNTFEPYHSDAGGKLEMLVRGTRSADSMFKAEHQSNTMLTWVLRGVGAFLVMLGISMMLNPLVVLGDVVPLIGSIIGAGVGFIAFIAGMSLSILTIAIAWIFYRPLLGGALIALSIGLLYFIRTRAKSKKTNAPGESEAPRASA